MTEPTALELRARQQIRAEYGPHSEWADGGVIALLDALEAAEERARAAEAKVARINALHVAWGSSSMARIHGWPVPQMIQDLSDALDGTGDTGGTEGRAGDTT